MSTTAPPLRSAFVAIVRRDFRLAFYNRSDLVNPLLFFVIVVSLFPFGVGSNPEQLREIAPGVIWVAALLATLLGLDGLFKPDFEDGTLEQLALAPHPLSILVLAKILVHWLLTGIPLIAVTPVIALLLNLDPALLPTLLLSLLIGTPSLSLIGAIGVALTAGIRRGGVLLTLLVLPLYIPVLIFGANLLKTAQFGLDTAGQFYVLAAILMLALVLAPIAAASALRISLN
ncbi:MAG: heme exporter protein B [marine bacterium B5-7]|nr:MAG: heme exporter protein B [marine bacterium B5-7]